MFCQKQFSMLKKRSPPFELNENIGLANHLELEIERETYYNAMRIPSFADAHNEDR